jgi:hypothetical protein
MTRDQLAAQYDEPVPEPAETAEPDEG